jgi:hypothetical protein
LLNEALTANAAMPKDVLKFANKLKGLCEGISQKVRTPIHPSKMTVDVMKELLDERIIENAGLQ